VIAAALVAYHNTFSCPFIFDDLPRIVRNPLIHQLWPPWVVMAGTTRPLVQYSLAWNHAISGVEPWSYHALNLVIHALAGLTLLGVIRRTLASPRFPERYRAHAPSLALAAALIWVVHPVQTQAVTYVIQRAESLAGWFYLLTLYAVIRGADAPHPRRWHATAIVACALGMASKPVMVTAPLAVLAYDRMFLSASFRELGRGRGGLHAGLFATLGLVPLVLANGVQDWRTSSGPNVAGMEPLSYALTQAGVLLHYLRLCLWPHPLCLDYAWPIATDLRGALGPVLAVSALLGLTAWASWRRGAAGFLGIGFFLLLAPTSSFVPIADPAFEHRLYLPLAAPVVLAVLGAWEALRAVARRFQWSWGQALAFTSGAVVLAVVALTTLTVRRNHDYRSAIAIWSDTVRKRPENPRARVNLGLGLLAENRIEEGLSQLEEAVRIDPAHETAQLSLGFWLSMRGETAAGLAHLREAVRLAPDNGEARFALGAVLVGTGALDEAYPHLVEARRLEPERSATRYNLGHVLEQRGRLTEAIAEYSEAVRLKPDDAGARASLGLALARSGRIAEGRHQLERALALRPGDERVRRSLEEVDRLPAGARGP
jgi:Flp pilus assembly protein TadD